MVSANQDISEIDAIKAEVQQGLMDALPLLRQTAEEVQCLTMREISEIRSLPNPPPEVVGVVAATMTMLGHKTDWNSSKRIL